MTLGEPRAPGHRLADRLDSARRRLFVGRASERELFRQALIEEEPLFAVVYIYGPGGVGKTTLLREWVRLAREEQRTVAWLDGRDLDASPQDFLRALSRTLQPFQAALTTDSFAGLPSFVLVIDTYEQLAPLDSWLRDSFLPHLPARALVAIAGRNAPASPWQTDPAWRDLARIVSLRNLRPEESQELLERLGVPPRYRPAAVASTYGHPLALVLAADLLKQRPADQPFDLAGAPDAVGELVERFARDAPGPPFRQALDICAHVRLTTESLLTEVLGPEMGPRAFAWLRTLTFIEEAPDGLFPHDLVRDALDADLRWRNPEAYRELRRRVRRPLVRRYRQSSGLAQQQAFFDLLYLHRQQPWMKPFYEWKALGTAHIEAARPEDRAAILAMVERHEGEESARIAAYWLERQPRAFEVFRGAGSASMGFVVNLLLETVTPEDERADPAIRQAWAYVRRHGPMRPGEVFLHSRFWMGRDCYQEPLIHNLTATAVTRHWLGTANLAWAFPCGARPDYWEPMFSYLNFNRAPDADFEVGGRRYGVFAHDWRAEPPGAWLELMGERELDMNFEPQQAEPAAPPPLLVLSQPEFARAVRLALRDYGRPQALAANPLLRARAVHDLCGPAGGAEDLQAVLRAAAETLCANPKDEKLYRALDLTYFRPAPTQEAAAELLDLPFSTYRYHLAKGVDRVVEWLWNRELYGTGQPGSPGQ